MVSTHFSKGQRPKKKYVGGGKDINKITPPRREKQTFQFSSVRARRAPYAKHTWTDRSTSSFRKLVGCHIRVCGNASVFAFRVDVNVRTTLFPAPLWLIVSSWTVTREVGGGRVGMSGEDVDVDVSETWPPCGRTVTHKLVFDQTDLWYSKVKYTSTYCNGLFTVVGFKSKRKLLDYSPFPCGELAWNSSTFYFHA